MSHKKSESLKTAVTEQFQIDYPVIAAPMFLVSTTRLVTAVGAAGGLGTFPAFIYRPTENYRNAIREIKTAGSGPFGINIIVQQSNRYRHEQLDIALEEEVPLIITSLGSPKEIIAKARQTNTKVYCDVVHLEHAQKVADLGAHGVIAVGSGAGGHAGDISSFALIPQLVRALSIPVIAAGSIVDGSGMAAALALGASAVYMGTRFIAATEAEVDEAYKQTILDAHAEDIVNTAKVDGFPGNFIRTPLLESLGLQPGAFETLVSKSKKIKRMYALSRAARSLLAADKSKISYKTVYSAGHGVSLIDRVQSVDEIIQETMRGYRETIARLPK